MDINQLKYFVSVAQTLSFTQAAKRNGTTQPSISHHIGELEKHVGAKLFLRDKRNVSLTVPGKELLPYALEIIEAAETAIFNIKQLEEGVSGHIAISSVTAASKILSNCLTKFAQQYPDIVVDISFTSGRDQVIDLSTDKFDFHFALEDMIPTGTAFEYIESHVDPLCLILPPGHPMANQEVDFSKLKDEKFIIAAELDSPALYEQVMSICSAHNYKPKIVNRYDRSEGVILSVSSGLGISIVPRSLCEIFGSNEIGVLPLDGPDSKRTQVIAWHRESTKPAVKLFRAIVKEIYGNKDSKE